MIFLFLIFLQESLSVINNLTCKQAAQDDSLRTGYCKIIDNLREVVAQLPKANFVTAARLISHLKRVSEHEEDNAMSASNLGIVFGPTLLRPRYGRK